ncbi:hypothetical protein Pint_11847 [Pistacia integerrima]|uniref:Uncharacterized protein n=1 Tax=Pistacia integerrima TaxID=434235 RepID=A0ACC0XK63_9ROSI|nr:hypothetical protein Pint_11847 [Pistacia integerrima]
MKLYSKAT